MLINKAVLVTLVFGGLVGRWGGVLPLGVGLGVGVGVGVGVCVCVRVSVCVRVARGGERVGVGTSGSGLVRGSATLK